MKHITTLQLAVVEDGDRLLLLDNAQDGNVIAALLPGDGGMEYSKAVMDLLLANHNIVQFLYTSGQIKPSVAA